MDNEFSEEFFIPYKFYDDLDEGLTIVYCRGIESGSLNEFNLRQKSWLIVDPFRYSTQSDDEVLASLQKSFRTSAVFYDKDSDRYLVRDFDQTDFCEDDYKSVSFLPETYTTKIAMNKRRYYNLFSDKGEWTENKGVEYSKMESHQLLLSVDPKSETLMYKLVSGDNFENFTEEIWDSINQDIDIIFSNVRRSVFEEMLGAKIPSRIDFAWISDQWNADNLSLDVWYGKNIEDIYLISYMSSRNLSQILNIESKKDWEYLTDDMLLSIDLSLYETTKCNRFSKNYCVPGKYRNLYFYKMGDILLRLLELSSCSKTVNIWKRFLSLSKWSSIISNVYSYERLNPINFTLPESCIYMDHQYFVTATPLEENYTPVFRADYMIVLSEGSYLTFDISNKKSVFKGRHPLCQPLFPAIKRSIENYMLCSAKNFNVNIEAICDVTDKTKDSLRIPIYITSANFNEHKRLLDEHTIEKFETGKLKELEVSAWLNIKGIITTEYNPKETLYASNIYIQNILHSLDKIE